MISRWSIFLILILLGLDLQANEVVLDAEKLSLMQIFTEIPSTSMKVIKGAFTKESVGPWLGILGSTGVLYYYDEEILQNFQHAGRKMGIGNGDKTEPVITGFNHDLLRLPTDTGSTLYFLGDGWIHMSIASGFLLTGYAKDAVRPYNTGLQLIHGMLVSTIFSQALKRSFGREDPNFSSRNRGAWRPFPSFTEYNSEVAKYDAMPSGHIMTATLTFTVIYTNYPEYSAWILPIAGTWLTLLGFEMVNNGVHWASDYPLGIAMGYYIGKLATKMGGEKSHNKDSEGVNKGTVTYFPLITPEGTTLNLIKTF